MHRVLFIIIFFHCGLFARKVETFYGLIEVSEPVILELIDSPPMQRLKKVYQYGISHFTTHKENYTRYDHSLGVFAILRLKDATLEEQIAGLLHDVSHTVFSHVGDYVFEPNSLEERGKAYQDNIHGWFLEKYGIGKILEKHGFTIAELEPTRESFPALEQNLPDLCADRIDYNLQGAFHRKYLSKNEVLEILQNLQFTGGRWISTKPDLIKKMVRYSLFMNRDCWGSHENYVTSCWLAEIISRGLKVGKITFEDIHFGTDENIWNRLRQIPDPQVQERFYRIFHPKRYYKLVETRKADIVTKRKFRGIDPWIQEGNQLFRLTELDQELKAEYEQEKSLMEAGWSIKYSAASICGAEDLVIDRLVELFA